MTAPEAALRRRLNLPLLILYGIGVTVGAGIYVLVGNVAGHAGAHAPLAFVFAAIVMGLTVASYAEMCARFPVAAGEAAYVRAALRSRLMSTLTGALMIGTGIISSATVALGATGYIAEFADVPRPLLLVIIVVGLGLVAAWGVLESVVLASLFTLVEVGGLLAIVFAATRAELPFGAAMVALPPPDAQLWIGIGFASLLAFFAFIGFEDLTNMAEETREPARNVPLAMAVTLVATTFLYIVIAAIAVTAVPPERLAASAAPLSLVSRQIAGLSPALIGVIAIFATLNTVIAQMTMATRVVYGMARQGDLPRVFGAVNARTATPLLATAAIVAGVLVLAILAPLEPLAEATSLVTLVVFALVNLSLIVLRSSGRAKREPGILHVPLAVPALGLLSCLALIASALF